MNVPALSPKLIMGSELLRLLINEERLPLPFFKTSLFQLGKLNKIQNTSV